MLCVTYWPTTYLQFYRITVSRSLFGNLILTRTWGRIGSKHPREIHREFSNTDSLMLEVGRILTVRKRRGYQLIQDDLPIPYPWADTDFFLTETYGFTAPKITIQS